MTKYQFVIGDLSTDLLQLKQRSGPLTNDLVLTPAQFGLGKVPYRIEPDAATTSVCGYCSTGCGLKVHLKNNHAINLSADFSYPVNLGMACPKGWEALSPLEASDRGTTPLIRSASGEMKPASWDTALSLFCDRIKSIQSKYRPASAAFISTGQMVTEEMAFLGALAKFGMGMVHGDGNTRQCMATAVAAYKQSFGFDAPPYTYKDFEESDVIFLVGSNLCIAHPILWQRILMNRKKPRVIVIDPRRTETAMAASDHVGLKPKSDLTLFYGLAHILIRNGWIKREFIEAHTEGFHDFSRHVEAFTPARVSSETGIDSETLLSLARTIFKGSAVSFWWTMGVNQSHEGTRTAQAIINLALMTGNIGRPGTGANSITGQCNAMGSRLFSNTTNLMGGHDFTNPLHRQKVSDALGIPLERIPDRHSYAYDQIMNAIESGEIRALWIIATNTAHSWMSQARTEGILRKLEFLVVQDMYPTTDTARCAHLYLPAGGWGEKEGTFINSERRFGITKKVRKAPGDALADFNIFKLISHYWGCGDLFKEWDSPQSVFNKMKATSQGQPCDITGIIDYEMLDREGGVQWPAPMTHAVLHKERRLFEDGRFYHENQKAKFIFSDPAPIPEPPSSAFPFHLNTGRGSSSQWHTETRTGKSKILNQLHPHELIVEINTDDALNLGIKPGNKVILESLRGSITAIAHPTSTVQPGSVFLAMHSKQTNQLTLWVVDPHSRQPAYKSCSVSLRKLAI
ncbi:MAG: molybdopterin-dependent oxidoreductase [Verrucomicrobiota bacterium]|nr:molybdopterin-dependent oxidoreductase [Verrucomicrobiota bacterium]